MIQSSMWRLPSGWIKLLSTCRSGRSWSRRSIPNYFQRAHVAFMDKGQTCNLILLINLNVNLIDLNSCLMTTQDMILRAYYCWVAAMLTHTHTHTFASCVIDPSGACWHFALQVSWEQPEFQSNSWLFFEAVLSNACSDNWHFIG